MNKALTFIEVMIILACMAIPVCIFLISNDVRETEKWEKTLPTPGQEVLFDGKRSMVLGRNIVHDFRERTTFRLRVPMPNGYSEITVFLSEIQPLAESSK